MPFFFTFLTCPVTHLVCLNPVRKRKLEDEHFCWVNHLLSLKQACMLKDTLPIYISSDVNFDGQSVGPGNVKENMQPGWIISNQHEV